MTSASLTIGSALLAFSPSLSLLILLVFPKPQLVILSICSAFAYLLSALLGSSLWWLLTLLPIGDSSWPLLILPSIFSQFLIRCGFASCYFRVELVIRRSVAKHEAESRENGDAHETEALQLRLNDLSCAIASGAGWALFHSLFLYGTLLASESGERYMRSGTLYQESCGMPGLVNGALIGGMFSILDVVLMCAVFYGMRRRGSAGNAIMSVLDGLLFWKGIPDSVVGGHTALGLAVIGHLGASLALLPNRRENGCQLSLPLLAGVVILVSTLFLKGVAGHFLPEDQRRRIGGFEVREGGGNANVENERHVD